MSYIVNIRKLKVRISCKIWSNIVNIRFKKRIERNDVHVQLGPRVRLEMKSTG
jgi:hypothetical protein